MNYGFLVKETLQITPFTHKHSHSALFTPSGAAREMHGQADETWFFPSVVVRAFCTATRRWGVSVGPWSKEHCRATDSIFCPTTPGAGCLISHHYRYVCVCLCVFSGACGVVRTRTCWQSEYIKADQPPHPIYALGCMPFCRAEVWVRVVVVYWVHSMYPIMHWKKECLN